MIIWAHLYSISNWRSQALIRFTLLDWRIGVCINAHRSPVSDTWPTASFTFDISFHLPMICFHINCWQHSEPRAAVAAGER